ncbi:hypothetical protein PSJE_17390 [Pseudomonas jessenii]|nr:hypothetical protein PSJE_17390 [Pseudomonas jessenii]
MNGRVRNRPVVALDIKCMKIQNDYFSGIGFMKAIEIIQHIGKRSTRLQVMSEQQPSVDVTIARKPLKPDI